MSGPRLIAAVTGTRADYGLLRPVMRAIDDHPDLVLSVHVTGAHLLPPITADEVAADFPVAATVTMQTPGPPTRAADAVALGHGVLGFAERFAAARPDLVLVLGDRIEAFAAAAAAAVAGVHLAHLHGGDRAEGIADESMRHAISKLAHVHLPATETSAARLTAMGEDPARIHVVGSPALDDLPAFGPLDDNAWADLGRPEIVMLLHPTEDDDGAERGRAADLATAALQRGRVLALAPNHDPGRAGVAAGLADAGVRVVDHLPRAAFVGLLRRAGMIVGNSSAGLIEAAALSVRCVNVGRRQAGRERPHHVIDCPTWAPAELAAALDRARAEPLAAPVAHPYGDGTAGPQTAAVLAAVDSDNHPIAKRCTY